MTHPPCLRLCPAYPGNPRNRIEGESPHQEKGHTVFAPSGLQGGVIALVAARHCRCRCHVAAAGIPQGQRLLLEHRLDRLARGLLVDMVMGEKVAGFRQDQVDVLQFLEPLELIVLAQSHALADELEHIDDTERKIALMRAQLAMIGVWTANSASTSASRAALSSSSWS